MILYAFVISIQPQLIFAQSTTISPSYNNLDFKNINSLSVSLANTNSITIDLVTVDDPKNDPDEPRYGTLGSVAASFQIGKYDVTAEQYCAFLNAIAKKDPHALYNTNMSSDNNVACIVRSEDTNGFCYSVIPGTEKFPITYVRYASAVRFCNWMENNQPIGEQTLETTESGSFNIVVSNTIVTYVPQEGATWSLPTEAQWYKTAYYQKATSGSGATYYSFGTSSYDIPGNKIAEADQPNRANYCLNNLYTMPNPPYLTPVGTFTASASPFGAYDMTGNVDQWLLNGSIRGGSWASANSDELGIFSRTCSAPTGVPTNTIGFRLVYNVEPPLPPLLKSPTIIDKIETDADSVKTSIEQTVYEFKNILHDPQTPIMNTFGYLLGWQMLGEWPREVINIAARSSSTRLTLLSRYLPASIRSLSLPESLRPLSNFLFSPVDRSAQLNTLNAVRAEREISKIRSLGYLAKAKANLARIKENLPNEANPANLRIIDGEGSSPGLISAEEEIATAAVTQAEADTAAITIATDAITAEVAGEVALAGFFATPALAVTIPILALCGAAAIIDYGHPSYGTGLMAYAGYAAYQTLKIFSFF